MRDLEEYYLSAPYKKQLVTIFLLTYKRPQYLKLAINSILAQSYSNFYLIVLDNCSHDDTRDVVLGFSDSRIIYIERQSTSASSNSQYAFDNCKTKYLIVLHDDDVYDVEYLQKILSAIEDHNYAAVSVRADIINEDGKVIEKSKPFGADRIFKDHMYLISLIRGGKYFNSMMYPSAIYRASFFGDRRKFVDFSAGPAGDQLVWLQAERFGGTLCILDEKLFGYRKHQNQASSKNLGTMELKLFSYLCQIKYYKNIINKYSSYMALSYIKNILALIYRYAVYKNIEIEEIKSSIKNICIDILKKSIIGIFTIFGIKIIEKNLRVIVCLYPRLRMAKRTIINIFLFK